MDEFHDVVLAARYMFFRSLIYVTYIPTKILHLNKLR